MSAPTVEGFAARVDQILSPVIRHGQLVNRLCHSVSEARIYQKELSSIQTQLRSAKKDIRLQMKAMRLNSGAARAGASAHPLMGAFFGKNRAIHARAVDRQNLKAHEHNVLLPWEGLLNHIDRQVQYLDTVKLNVDKAIQDGRIS